MSTYCEVTMQLYYYYYYDQSMLVPNVVIASGLCGVFTF